MPKAEVNSVSLEYIEYGTGPSVVFVHGSTSDLRTWTHQVDAFASKYRAVALSCRHHYPNAEIPDDVGLSVATLTEDLAGFLHTLDLAPAHLVGHEAGALVCLLLALSEPKWIRTLVLAEPPMMSLLGLGDPPKPHQLLRLLVRSPRTGVPVLQFGVRGIVPAERAFARGDDERGLQTFLRAVLGREAFAKLTQAKHQQARDNIKPLRARFRAGLPPFGEEAARHISAPTLLVTGEHSAPVLHRLTDRLERLMPRVERVEIRNASHRMYEDNPAAFNETVLAFLERHRD
jgi:non-heme chloroperoxidase